jgi:hypothetical protein
MSYFKNTYQHGGIGRNDYSVFDFQLEVIFGEK